MTTLDIVKNLASTSSRNEKERILFNAFMNGEREFFEGARLALDPLVTFGVKKVALIEEDDDVPGSFTFEQFRVLVSQLRSRELTGHAARDAINEAALSCDAATWNLFYRRVILKDLNVGVEAKTINKVLNKAVVVHPEARDYMIGIFMAQMAHDGTDPAHAKKLRGRKMLDPKLNGVRLLTVLDKEEGTVTQFTGRNGNINENFTEIREALQRVLDVLPGSVVLDGEVIMESFQELMSQIGRKEDRDTSTARLALFDIIPLSDFRAGLCPIAQEKRHDILTELETSGLLKQQTNGLVYVIPKVTVDLDTEEGRAEAQRITEEAIAAGFEEAVMYKDPDAPYECGKRSANWLKKKPIIEVSLKIVGFEAGDAEGKNKDTLGALICEGHDLNVDISVKVGSGLTDELRQEIWSNQGRYLGMIVEIRADALSLEKDGTVYSLRFPRFKGFRGTKKGEKL